MARPTRKKVFTLSFSGGQSIGPSDLQAMWSRACDSPHIAVSRNAIKMLDRARLSYGLWAGLPFNRDVAEQRMRMQLQARGYYFSMMGIVH